MGGWLSRGLHKDMLEDVIRHMGACPSSSCHVICLKIAAVIRPSAPQEPWVSHCALWRLVLSCGTHLVWLDLRGILPGGSSSDRCPGRLTRAKEEANDGDGSAQNRQKNAT